MSCGVMAWFRSGGRRIGCGRRDMDRKPARTAHPSTADPRSASLAVISIHMCLSNSLAYVGKLGNLYPT